MLGVRNKIGMFFLLFLILCASCQSPSPSSSRSKSVFRINLEEDPQSIDPRKVMDLNAINLVRNLFEGLTRIDSQGNVELGLAEEILVSEDKKFFTFKLKKTVWSDQSPLTAHDFVYAWQQCLSPSFCCDAAFQMYVIKGAKNAKEGRIPLEEVGICALDDYTLQVELEKPTAYFLSLLTSPPFFPVQKALDLKNPKWAENVEDFVGNGPFSLKNWEHHNCVEIAKNPTYWDSEHVQLDGIYFVMVSAETELMMFEKGELDWVGSPFSALPLEAIQTWKKSSALLSKQMLGTYFLSLNTEIFQDPQLRRSLSYAIDRQAIVDHITQGGQIPATGVVPPVLGLQKTPYFSDAHLEVARSFFEETSCAKNLSKIALIYPAREKNRMIAQGIQQQWRQVLGIEVELEALESKVYYNRLSKKDYQLAIGSWVADFEDPITFLEVFKYRNGKSNNTLWENSEYITLLDQASFVIDPLKRRALLAKSEAILIEEMPIIPIFHYTMLYSHCPEIKNVVLSHLGQIDFKWAYFEEEKK